MSAPRFQPIDMGIQIATPYNTGNLIRNNVAGPIAVAIALFYGLFLLGGILAKPFAKIFGIGVPGYQARFKRDDNEDIRFSNILTSLDFDDAFLFYDQESELQNDSCQRKILCYFHRQLLEAPQFVQSIYRFFSLRMRNVDNYKEDIVLGLSGGDCDQKYTHCKRDIVDLLTGWPIVRKVMEKSIPNIGATWNGSV